MAILDTLFGTPQSTMLGGLLGNEQMDKLRQQALTSGLINTAIGYLAQPKNQRLGSAFPYVARALVAGQQGAQGVYDDALRSWQMQQKIDEANREKAAREARQRVLPELLGMPSAYRGTTTQTVQGAEYATPTGDVSSPFTAQFQTQRMPDTQVQTPTFNQAEYIKDLAMSGYGEKMLESQLARERKSPFGQVDVSKFTPESIRRFEQTGIYSDLDPIERTEKLPVSAQEYELARKDPNFRKFLNEKWLANFYATQPYRQTEQELQQQEYEYRYGSPQSSTQPPRQVSVTTGGKTYYFPSQEAANAFKRQAGIK